MLPSNPVNAMWPASIPKGLFTRLSVCTDLVHDERKTSAAIMSDKMVKDVLKERVPFNIPFFLRISMIIVVS
jgi:hypothetical protein